MPGVSAHRFCERRTDFVESTQLKDRIAAALQSPALAIIAAFLLRMSLLWSIHRDRDAHQFLFFPSSHETWNVAWAMVLGNGFSSPLAGMHGPTAWVAPCYPWLLAFGLRLSHHDGYAAMILCLFLNCLMSALTCWPIYGIGKKIGSHEIGLTSCWLWVFLPTAVIFPLEWLWDPSFSAFFLALLIYWTLDLPAASSILPWVGYGLLWGIAVLMNPAIGILLPFLLLWLVQHRWRDHLPWWPQVTATVLFFALSLAPWTVRNYAAFGKLVPIKDNFGLELWLGNNSDVKRNWSPTHHPGSDQYEMQQLLQLGETNYMQVKQREALEFIEAQPRFFLKSALGRVVDTWTGLGDVPSDRWVSALHAGAAYIWITSTLSILAFVGLYLTWRSFGWEAAPIWIAPIVFPMTYYLTHSILRYRHPIDPVLTVLAVCALARARSFVSRQIVAQTPSSTVESN
jgi:dolichyl-phosphate-mannose-protein mannosyltransferase